MMSSLYGAVEDGGVTLPVLSYYAGTRALGLGTAYTALADDITSLYWNPAGLRTVNQKSVYLLYEKLYEGTTYGFGSFALPVEKIGTFAIGVINLSTGNILGVGENQEDLGIYSDSQTLFIVSYGTPFYNIKKLHSHKLRFFDIGISAKLLRHKIYTYTSYGFGIDLGFKYVPTKTMGFLRNFIFGLVIQNAFPPANKLVNDREWYPLKIKGGVTYRSLFDTLYINLDIDSILFRSSLPDISIGIEYTMMRLFKLRVGYSNGITAGMGMEIQDFTFNYAFNYNFDWGFIHQFSVSYKFGRFITF